MTTFLNLPLLDIVPDGSDDPDEDTDRRGHIIANPSGAFNVEFDATRPIRGRTYTFVMDGRAALKTMLDFINSVLGSYGAFWMPTWREDFNLLSFISTPDPTQGWARYNFDAFGFPQIFRLLNRRYVAEITNGGITAHRIWETGATSQTVEWMTLLGSSFIGSVAQKTIICHLPLFRLSKDYVQVTHYANDVHEVTLDLTELAAEVPVGN